MPTPASELNNGEWVLPKSNRSKTSDNLTSSIGNYGVSTRRSTKNKETFQTKNGDEPSSTTVTSPSEEHATSILVGQKKVDTIIVKEEPLDVPDIEESSVETSLVSDTESGNLIIDPVVKEEEKADQQSLIETIEIDNTTVTTLETGGEDESAAGPSSEASTSDNSFQCEQCFKFFLTKARLNGHARVHLKGKYKCEDCGKEFSGPSPLKYHRWNHIGNGIRKFICDYPECFKAFKSAQDLKRHSLVHSGTRPHHCDRCDRSFNLEWVLREHKKIHDGIRPYKCDAEGCNKSFYSHKDLKRHVIIHGSDTPFKCTRQECVNEKKGFRRKDNFIRHLMVVHEMKKEEAKIHSDQVEVKSGIGTFNNTTIDDTKTNILINLLTIKQDFESTRKATRILFNIFKHLDPAEVELCSQVCKLWNEIASKFLKNGKILYSGPLVPVTIVGKSSEASAFGIDSASTQMINKTLQSASFRLPKRRFLNEDSSARNDGISNKFPRMSLNVDDSKDKIRKPLILEKLLINSRSKSQSTSVIVPPLTSYVPNSSLEKGTNNPLNFLAHVASTHSNSKDIKPSNVKLSTPQLAEEAPTPTAALSLRLQTPFRAALPTSAASSSSSSNKRSGFENCIIFIGSTKVGKSHLCNEIFETYNSPTRFPVSKSVSLEDKNVNRKIAWGTVNLSGKTYTIIDTPRLFNQSMTKQQDVIGKNMCIAVSAVELCQHLNTIVYVFRDTFTDFDLLMVQRLYQLVGSKHVLLLMNKLSEEELSIPNMELTKNSIFKQLHDKKLLNKVDDFKLYGIKFRTSTDQKDVGAWTAKFHDYFINISYDPRAMKIPDVCYQPNVIKQSMEYEEKVVRKSREGAGEIVTNLLNNNASPDIKYDELGLGLPIARYLVEFVKYVDEYKVRYDGNYQFIRKREKGRRGPFAIAFNNLK